MLGHWLHELFHAHHPIEVILETFLTVRLFTTTLQFFRFVAKVRSALLMLLTSLHPTFILFPDDAMFLH